MMKYSQKNTKIIAKVKTKSPILGQKLKQSLYLRFSTKKGGRF